MRQTHAVALVALIAAASAAALWAPWWAALTLALGSLAAMHRGRWGFILFAGTTVALGALILGLYLGSTWPWGPFGIDRAGAVAGALGGIRLSALMGLNLALLSWWSAVRILDGLRLPPRVTALVAAALIAAHDVAGDLRRLWAAGRLDGDANRGWQGRARAAARWLPALLTMALRRAQVRHEALRLAGHRLPESVVPILAIAAVATASRLALAPVPHLKATYLLVFLGGLLFGPLAGAAAAALAMALSNLLLTGLLPNAFVNVPAMAAVGALGGALSRVQFAGPSHVDRAAGALLAGSVGVLTTLLFSVLADTTDWLVLRELRETGARGLAARIHTGLLFNALPAAFNGLLFALAVGPTQRTMQLLRGTVAPWVRAPHAPPRHAVPASEAPK